MNLSNRVRYPTSSVVPSMRRSAHRRHAERLFAKWLGSLQQVGKTIRQLNPESFAVRNVYLLT
jgi:hypothetical protein